MHGADGTDEISISGPTFVAELDDGAVREFEVHPEDAGLPVASVRGDPRRRARPTTPRRFRALLDGAPGAYRDAVLLNAAAALVVAERAATLNDGVVLARELHRTAGRARDKVAALARLTRPVEAIPEAWAHLPFFARDWPRIAAAVAADRARSCRRSPTDSRRWR